MALYRKVASVRARALNDALLTGFLQHQDDDEVHKTHLFEGRYENIYLKPQHIPELQIVIDEAVAIAEDILQMKGLRAGYWFNSMPPGSLTLPHTHDDDDELLSAAYYVCVPENSGKLHLHKAAEQIDIQPVAGEFIFFKPDIIHEVSKNASHHHRLSIGMNFGQPAKQK